jgi:VacB/RNase II family 3'-5' exoribonuclease
MNRSEPSHREILVEIATRAMTERGLWPTFSPEALTELDHLHQPAPVPANQPALRDMRDLLWCSIDNDDSRDLDQLSAAQALPGGQVKILVAIADVAALVKEGTAINAHAAHNTTSVYTPAVIFSMLPEKLSTDLTSLNAGVDRLAIVIEMIIAPDGSLQGSDVCSALVRNQARLAYQRVADWLEGSGPPQSTVPGLGESLRLQERVAQEMKKYRCQQGALSFETVDAAPVMAGDAVGGIGAGKKNRASDMIENFMIVANGVTARFLAEHGFPSIRRVVQAPARWDRIVEIAQQHGETLPGMPDSIALEQFLQKQKARAPQQFHELSLTIIKLIGAGEYAAEPPGDTVPDHFGLAARDYTHSTAPNRRYPDLITQRMIQAALAGRPAPYPLNELQALAKHCTLEEDEAGKVERQVHKSAAALLLRSRIGERFDAVVTGASAKGTWVRLAQVPVEGKLMQGFQGVDVGDRLQVVLISVDVEQGFIDFRKV